MALGKKNQKAERQLENAAGKGHYSQVLEETFSCTASTCTHIMTLVVFVGYGASTCQFYIDAIDP